VKAIGIAAVPAAIMLALQLMGWLTGSETYPLAVRPAGTAVQSAADFTRTEAAPSPR